MKFVIRQKLPSLRDKTDRVFVDVEHTMWYLKKNTNVMLELTHNMQFTAMHYSRTLLFNVNFLTLDLI